MSKRSQKVESAEKVLRFVAQQVGPSIFFTALHNAMVHGEVFDNKITEAELHTLFDKHLSPLTQMFKF